jgi:hypothetical protein
VECRPLSVGDVRIGARRQVTVDRGRLIASAGALFAGGLVAGYLLHVVL